MENYTRIPNIILDMLIKCDLNGSQRRIIDIVIRQTYGFQREAHKLSISFIATATDTNKMQVQRELARLIERKIIIITQEASFTKSREIAMNEDVEQWENSKQLAKKLTPSEKDKSTVSELANSTVSVLANQRKKDIKENNKEKDLDKSKPKKSQYGQFKNVLLTDEEYQKVKVQNSEKIIEDLDMYKESTGKKYKSDYATILNWQRKNNPGTETKRKEISIDV